MVYLNKLNYSNLFFIGLLIIFSCKKKDEVIHYYLTDEQKAFIQTPHTGDTCIWQSSNGYYDTAIVPPVIYEDYIITPPGVTDPQKIGQKASYTYQFVGHKKSQMILGLIDVIANDDNLIYLKTRCESLYPVGVIASRKFGSITYQNVYWNDQFANPDTIFWNEHGYLGHVFTTETLIKVK